MGNIESREGPSLLPRPPWHPRHNHSIVEHNQSNQSKHSHPSRQNERHSNSTNTPHPPLSTTQSDSKLAEKKFNTLNTTTVKRKPSNPTPVTLASTSAVTTSATSLSPKIGTPEKRINEAYCVPVAPIPKQESVSPIASASRPSAFQVLSRESDKWQTDLSNCSMCNRDFAVFLRRHHCRKCGACICSNCSRFLSHPFNVRLCLKCIKNNHRDTEKISLITPPKPSPPSTPKTTHSTPDLFGHSPHHFQTEDTRSLIHSTATPIPKEETESFDKHHLLRSDVHFLYQNDDDLESSTPVLNHHLSVTAEESLDASLYFKANFYQQYSEEQNIDMNDTIGNYAEDIIHSESPTGLEPSFTPLSIDESTEEVQETTVDNKLVQAVKISDRIIEEDDFHWTFDWVNSCTSDGGYENSPGSRTLYTDFVKAAEKIAVAIISELNIPNDKKTYPPVSVGGIAGGEKFVVSGIFFKLSTDTNNLYGGIQWAMKASNHELKGLKCYLSCSVEGLNLPMAVIIDYLGYRILAISLIPINRDTLVYGSGNGGKTVQADSAFSNLMKQAALKLNLKSHLFNGTTLWSAADIEGHKGFDNRFYLIDCARSFPPEPVSAVCMAVFLPNNIDCPVQEVELERYNMEYGILAFLSPPSASEAKIQSEHYTLKHKNIGEFVLFFFERSREDSIILPQFEQKNERASQVGLQEIYGDALLLSGLRNPHLCLLMRPELVKLSPTPLSPDAFTLFNQSDPNHVQNNIEVIAAYKQINTQIAILTQRLLSKEELVLHSSGLRVCLHSYGINMRYLGKLRNFVRSSVHLSSLFQNEMIARVSKNFIREKMRLVRSSSIEEYQQVVANYFNVIFGEGEISHIYWCFILKSLIWLKYGAYGEPLLSSERKDSFDFRKQGSYRPYNLFLTLQTQIGVRFASETEAKRLFRDKKIPVFNPKDVTFITEAKTYLAKSAMSASTLKRMFGNKITPQLLLSNQQHLSMSMTPLDLMHVIFSKTLSLETSLSGEPIRDMIEIISQLYKQCPVELVTAVHFVLGSYYLTLDRYDLAETRFRYARRHLDSIVGEMGHPLHLIATDYLARTLIAQGREEEIRYFCDKFLRVWEEYPLAVPIFLERIFNRDIPTTIEFYLNRVPNIRGDARRKRIQYLSSQENAAATWLKQTNMGSDTLSGLTTDITELYEELRNFQPLTPAPKPNKVESSGRVGDVVLWGKFGSEEYNISEFRIKLSVDPGTKVVSIAAGQNVAYIVTETSAVFSLGQNSPALGINAQKDYYQTPQLIRGLQGKKIVSVCCSTSSFTHVLALSSEGTIYSFGYNKRGQLGVGDTVKRTTPVRAHLPLGFRAVAISCGHEHSLALSSRGKLYGWGSNTLGEINDTEVDILEPELIESYGAVLSCSAVKHLTTYITKAGVWCRGSFQSYEKRGAFHISRPKLYPQHSATNSFHRVVGQFAITTSGTVYAFGWDDEGELGASRPGECLKELTCPCDFINKPMIDICAAGTRSYFLTTSGELYMCGDLSDLSTSNPITLQELTEYSGLDSCLILSKTPKRRVAPVRVETLGFLLSSVSSGNSFVLGIVGDPQAPSTNPDLLSTFHQTLNSYVDVELSLWEFGKHKVKFKLPSFYEQSEVFPASVHFTAVEQNYHINYFFNPVKYELKTSTNSSTAKNVIIFGYPDLVGTLQLIAQKREEVYVFTITTPTDTFAWVFSSNLHANWWKAAVDSISYSFEFEMSSQDSLL